MADDGPIGFDRFMELALYGPGGFFTSGGGAGRAGADFLTSPEVGPLFGAVVARYLDSRWLDLGRPDPFIVVEAAAGRGALAIAVLAAEPACAGALRYVMVERSETLRERQGEHLTLDDPADVLDPARSVRGPQVCSLAELPEEPIVGVVVANELLDNIPVRLFERSEQTWVEVHVGIRAGHPTRAGETEFGEVVLPAPPELVRRLDTLAPGAEPGARIPLQEGAARWVTEAVGRLRAGSLLVFDYASTTGALASRPVQEWIRTYRTHERGSHPYDRPGSQDITCEVALDQLTKAVSPTSVSTQREWLADWGIDELVEEGRRIWAENASAPSVAAFRARSRVSEAEALTDPDGLGDFRVLEWRR